jgi:hypothetical protein
VDAHPRGESLVRTTRSIADASLRVAYLRDFVLTTPVPPLARALDEVCARAEQAEEAAREALVALVDALNLPELEERVQRLREEAAGETLLALERLIRHPASHPPPGLGPDGMPRQERIPDYGRGRSLTLGERKALARRPDRAMLERLLGDPHPDVIHRALASPRITEEDVVRLAAKRPCPGEVLAAIAREPRWAHRSRVRLALMLNPATPLEIATTIAGLLMRQELRLVVESTRVASEVRALCVEHLERRPPMEGESEEGAAVH